LENYGPAASHWKIMDLLQSLENHGPAASHWKTMKKAIGKPWTGSSQFSQQLLMTEI
jgi:hypothetical protein